MVVLYGFEWMFVDFLEDILVMMDEYVQKVVDCYNVGVIVLYLYVCEFDGKGSKWLLKFNELFGWLCEVVLDMILQVGGLILFVLEGDGVEVKWLFDDMCYMFVELMLKFDQVMVVINIVQMNIIELMSCKDIVGMLLNEVVLWDVYCEMMVFVGFGWVDEYLCCLQVVGIQLYFQLIGMYVFEMFEWIIWCGVYCGLLNVMWVGIGGGFDGLNLYNFMEFVWCCLDGVCIMFELLMKNVLLINMVVMVFGLYLCCGIEDMIIDQKGNWMMLVQQVEQCVWIVCEFG